ncbi:hypothetical protein PR048_028974 [Dryococelus australis]|uniref:DUF4371 domain-containing protein n=1 Tax=Dryococelus australis TaxID=614101 RepID=A0ABQ9GC34_9NEOP|nr:hypothetical protein PR048_028974 [Dryococelus australis]
MPLRKKSFAELKNTRYFTIMADETTDISIKEQLAICIRYFNTTLYEIQEKFFKFIDVVDVSGENIAHTILQELDRLNLDISYCYGSNVFSFLHATQSSEFLISVVVLAEVFGLTLAVARKLQAEYRDVLEEMKLVEAILASLRDPRYKSIDTFKKIFRESEKLAMEMWAQINKPKTTNLQNNRSNCNLQTVVEYYRTAVYLPFTDFIINELSSKLPKSELQRVGQIQKLLSPEFSNGFEDKVLQGAEPYKDDLPCFSALKGELRCLEADMEIRSFTKVSKVSCRRLQTDFCTTKH